MNAKPDRRTSTAALKAWRLRPVCMAIVAMGLAPSLQALPTGPKVVAGQATVNTGTPGQMQIRQGSDKAIIDWRNFSIGSGELVRIDQPRVQSVLLNRVIGVDPSVILGRLQSNGRVFLSNPRGIVFGKDSQVDTGGFVATTLGMSNSSFLAGRYELSSVGTPGSLTADGEISAPGGTIALVSPVLSVGGELHAQRVGLASASSVVVDVEGDGLIFFNARNDGLNARLDMLGHIQADGGTAELRAQARAGFADTVLNMEGVVQARSIGQREGRVVIDGGTAGVTRVSGQVDASGRDAGEKGGTITVLGERVGLFDHALLEASGDVGGGLVQFGGGFKGEGAAHNAQVAYVAPTAALHADALTSGHGGQVVVWSDRFTRFEGEVSARGGARGGDGGNAEVSGKERLDYLGWTDLSASHGAKGHLLLDPKNLIISDTADINGDGNAGDDLNSDTLTFDEFQTATSKITAASVVNQLKVADVTLEAWQDITVSKAINAGNISKDSSLFLTAGRNILVNANIATKGGDIVLEANHKFSDGSGGKGGTVTLGKNVVLSTRGKSATTGDISLRGSGLVFGTGVSLVSGDNTTLVSTGAAAVHLPTLTSSGTLDITAGGDVDQTGILTVAGLTKLVADTNKVSFKLDNAGNDFAQVRVEDANKGSITTATVFDKNALIVGGRAGTLTANAGDTLDLAVGTYTTLNATAKGDITDSGTQTVSGTATLTANAGAITAVLDFATNDFGTVALASTGGGSITTATLVDEGGLTVSGNAATLTATTTGALTLGGGTYTTLNATSQGDIADSGVVTVTGTATFTADTKAVKVVLDSASNYATVQLANTGGGSISSAAVSDSGGGLTIGGEAGTLSVNSGGAVSLSAGQYTTLDVTAGGNVTDVGAGNLSVTGTTTFTATKALTVNLNNGNNDLHEILLASTGGGRLTGVAFTESNGITVGGDADTLSVAVGGPVELSGGSYGALNVSSKGDITDTGALTVTGKTTLTATDAITATLDSAANNFGTVALVSTGGGSFTSATLVDTSDIAVGGDAGVLTVNAGGLLTLNGGDYTKVDLTGTGGIAQAGAITTSAAGSTFAVGNGASINLASSANSLAGSANGGDNFVNAKDLQLRDTGDIELGATTLTGKLVLVSDGGNITQSGAIEVGADGSSFTTSGNNKNIVLDDVGNVFNGKTVSFNTATGGDVTVKADALVFAQSDIGGKIAAEALTGGIGQTATANNALTTGDTGSSFIVSAGQSIDLSKQANSFAGLPTQADTFTTDTSLKLRNVDDVSIGATTLSGALVLVSDTGGITQTGAISVGADGSSFTTSGNNQNIVLDNVGNLFNGHSVSFNTGTGGDATIQADALEFTKSTIGGKLFATALSGDITQTATANNALTTGEAGSVYTVGVGHSIDLSKQANSLAGLATHADTFAADTNLKLRNVGTIDIGATTLTGVLVLTSDTGAITQSGAIEVGADGSSFTTSGANQAITLNDAGNVFNGKTVSLNTASGNVSIQADALNFAASDVGGKLTATSLSGGISQSGALSLGADGSNFTAANNEDIVLTDAGNLFQGKSVSLNTTGTGNASVTAESLKFGQSIIAGTLTATTLTGGISQTGVIKTGTAGSTFTVAAGQNIDLSTSANELAGAAGAGDSFVGATDLQLRGKGDILLAATTLAGKLVLISDDGVIGQSGVISVGADGSSFTTSGAGKGIDLSTAVNQFNGHTVSFNTDSGDVAVSANGIKFAASDIGGALTASSQGAITQSGALSVDGLTTLQADTNAIAITLNNAGNDFGTVALASTGGGSITTATLVDAGALTVGGDAGTLSATAGGALALAGGSYTTLNANAKGNITDTGALTVSGTTTLTANTNAVTAALDTATNDFGTVTLANAAGGSFTSATLVDAGALSVGGNAGTLSVTTGGTLNLAGGTYTTLTVDTEGDVTDTGAVLVSGTTTLTARTNAVTVALNTATNDFGTVTLAAAGGGSFGAATVVDADDLTVGGDAGTLSITSGGAVVLAGGDYTTLNVNTKGNLSDTGVLTVSGTTTLTANTNAVTAALNTATNDFGTVTLAAAGGGSFTSATLIDANALTVGGNAGTLSVTTGDALTLAGGTYTTLNANTKGNVADAGAVTVSGVTTLTANTNAITAALNTATNNFGTVTLAAAAGGSFTGATLVDSGALIVGGNAASLSASAGGALTLAGGTYGALTASGASIAQTGALHVSGLTQLNSGAGDATLANAGNDFDTVGITAGRSVTLVDTGDLAFANSQVSNLLSVKASGNVTFSGVLSGAGGLTLQGPGTTLITTTQTYTGGTRINDGTLELEGAAARAGSGTVVLGAAGELLLNQGAVMHNAVSVQGGVIGNTQGTGLMDGAITLVDTVTFNVAGAAGGLTVNGNINDAGAGKGLEKNGTGWLTLGGNNNYSGPTNINQGTLVANGPDALPEQSEVTVADGAQLKLGGPQHLGALKGDGIIDLLNATLTVGSNNKSTDFSGSITGSGILIKIGNGTLTLSGTNTFDGSTQVNGGGLRLTSGTALADNNALSVGSGATLWIAANETIGSLSGAGTLNLDARLAFGGNGLSTTFSGAMHGTGGYDKVGTGVFTASGDNDYTGETRLFGGTVVAESGTALGSGAVTIGSAGTLDVREDLVVGSLTGSGHVALTGADLTTGGSNTSTTYSGVIGGTGGLHKAGTGTFTLSGANTFTGPVTVNQGQLQLAGGAALDDRVDVTVASGARLALAADETIDGLGGAGGVVLGAHRLSVGSNGGSSAFSGVASGSGGLTKLGSGTLTLAGNNTYSGSTVIQAGTLQIGQGGASGSLGSGAVTNGGTLVLNRSDAATLNNAIGGSGDLRVAHGQWTLGNAGNSYTGDTVVAGGELRTAGAERLPDGSNVRVAAGAALLLAGNETVASIKADGDVTVHGNVTTAGDQTYGGVLTVDSDHGVTFAGDAIDAQNAGNDWGGQAISVNADTARLTSANDMTLGNVRLANGGQIEATRLNLQGAVDLAGGTLDLIASAAPDAAKATPSEIARVAGSGKQLAVAEETVLQQDGSVINVASGAQLNITASGGGSVNLAQDANRFDGGLSVLSGPAFDTAWSTNVVGNFSIQSQVKVSGSNVNVSGQGIEADIIHVRADQLVTTGDSMLAARMPYDNLLLGTTLSAPGLILELAPGAFDLRFPFGRGGDEITVSVGSVDIGGRNGGPNAGYLQILPKDGTHGSTAVFLAGPDEGAGGVGYTFFHEGADEQDSIPVIYNGLLPETPQLSGALSSVSAVSEGARKDRFEETVRTENVTIRLRSGVIAEVGPGRPATVGSEGATSPTSCTPASNKDLNCAP